MRHSANSDWQSALDVTLSHCLLQSLAMDTCGCVHVHIIICMN